jgi:hypothetical protein
MTLPASVAAEPHKKVTLNASVETHVRVVVWSTARASQEHTEESVTVKPGAPTSITLTMPSSVQFVLGQSVTRTTTRPIVRRAARSVSAAGTSANATQRVTVGR